MSAVQQSAAIDNEYYDADYSFFCFVWGDVDKDVAVPCGFWGAHVFAYIMLKFFVLKPDTPPAGRPATPRFVACGTAAA